MLVDDEEPDSIKMDSDSRKRPLDGDSDGGASKRSNQGSDDNVVQLKILVPSIAAGAIIGKGGETVAQLQKETGAKIKMSKNNDYYPGTSERVCLVLGSLDSVSKVERFVSDKIRDKPDPSPKPVDGEIKVNLERHKQVKLLVPNSTAGMIIGKAGSYIKQIKDETGAFVQISQKSKDLNLTERCVTIAGEQDSNNSAMSMILEKIAEDPQSSSCPTISYADIMGPVASANPTGSPFASNSVLARSGSAYAGREGGNYGREGSINGGFNSGANIGVGMNNLNLNSSLNSGQMMQAANHNNGTGNIGLESLRGTLRGSGYTEQAVEEICRAFTTLANYGILGMGLGMGMLGNLGPNNVGLGGNMGINQSGNSSNVFGPMGTTSSGMGGGSNMGSPNQQGAAQNTSSLFGGPQDVNGESMFKDAFSRNYPGGNNSDSPLNQNSFGLGINMGFGGSGNNGMGDMCPDTEGGENNMKQELQVSENLIGVILGPGGRGIVELQHYSGATIQISKKGVYAPGTRNRLVTISGKSGSVSQAAFMVNQKVNQEEAKRQRQGTDR